MNVRHATPTDLSPIESLRRKDGSSLGFIPKIKYEHIVNRTLDRGRPRWKYEWLTVCEDNDDITGFCLSGFHRGGAKIEQICVREDARRFERALKLEEVIAEEAIRRRCEIIRCRVAYDIEANWFWKAVGYLAVSTITSTWLNQRESKSKRPLIEYERPLPHIQSKLFELFGAVT